MGLASLIPVLSRAHTYAEALEGRIGADGDFSAVEGLRVPLLAGLAFVRAAPASAGRGQALPRDRRDES